MNEFQQIDPRYMAMLQAGLGILAANNGRQPAGAAIGQGLLGGTNAYQQNLLQQQEAALRQQQMDMQKEQFGWQKAKRDSEKAQNEQQKMLLGNIAKDYGLDPNVLYAYPSIGENVIKNKLIPKDPELLIAPNGVAINKNDPTNFGKSFKEIDYNKPFLPDGTPNTAYQQFKLSDSERGASRTSVNVSTDKKYGEIFGTKLAEQDAAMIDASKSAPERLYSARRVKQLLAENPITGTGANARLSLEKAFVTAGLVDGTNVKNTEALASNLAAQTLEAIKTSGLGSGQGFTDKDRQFLEKAKSGNIEMNSGSLAYLADLNERAAIKSIERGNAVVKALKGNPSLGDVGGRLQEITIPEQEKPKPKIATLKDIADTAKATGKTTKQVTDDLKKRGYVIGK